MKRPKLIPHIFVLHIFSWIFFYVCLALALGQTEMQPLAQVGLRIFPVGIFLTGAIGLGLMIWAAGDWADRM